MKLTTSSLSCRSSSSSLRSAYSASTDPATASKDVSSLSSEAYFNARKSRRGWRETAGTKVLSEAGMTTRDVFPSSFFFLFFRAGRPFRYKYPVKDLVFISVYRMRDRTVGRSDQAASLSLSSWTLPSKGPSSGSSDDPMILTTNGFIRRLVSAVPKSRSLYKLVGSRRGRRHATAVAGRKASHLLTCRPFLQVRLGIGWGYEYNATS